MKRKHVKGSTDLLNQYDDFCSKCHHKSRIFGKSEKSTQLKQSDRTNQFWCRLYDEFMAIDKLKISRVFCPKGRFK